MAQKEIRFGLVGGGLMGREFASAAARWLHLGDLGVRPVLVAVCDPEPAARAWFEQNVPGLQLVTGDADVLLGAPFVDAVYCAVPHHLHEDLYTRIVRASKHLLGEKPFGIDRAATRSINAALAAQPDVLVRCSSEFPFFPGAYRIAEWVRAGRFGRIIEVEAGFWHSSDLNPRKEINWKRRSAFNGEYGCMGDLGLHVLHLPLRFGWRPANVRALLSNVFPERPGKDGAMVPADTWDNAILATEVAAGGQTFPMVLSMKRIAPGHGDTWFLRVYGTEFSAEFSTKNPKELRALPYTPGGVQAWHVEDVAYRSAYPAITGSIFEFGFSDALLQMWAAFCDELAHGAAMRQPLHCATPAEAAASHALFTAALTSGRTGQTVPVAYED
jgi:predicted dehydrogenase